MGLTQADHQSAPPESNGTHLDHMLDIVREYTNQTFWFSTHTVISLVIAYCVIIVLGLAGNILVITVICRKKSLRKSRNMYILNLSICDVIMCSVCMPFSLAKLSLKKWTLGLAMCRTMSALATIDVFVSTLTIVAIAVDRYMSIVHNTQVTTRRVILALGTIWTLAILLSTPLFCFYKIDTQKMYEHTFVQQCIDAWPSDRFREVYTTAVMLVQYLTPASVISYLHGRICRFLQFRHDDRPGFETQMAEKTRKDLRRHRTNMVLLTAVALAFSLTWLPLTTLNITADLAHEVFQAGQYNLFHAISLLIAMSSSAINPVIYGWFNSNFKSAFVEMLGFSNNEKSFETIEKSKNKSASSNEKPNYFWGSGQIKKSSKGSSRGSHGGRKQISSSPTSSVGKSATWTQAQHFVEQTPGNINAATNSAHTTAERVPSPSEVDSFLPRDQLASFRHYDSLSSSSR